MICKKCGNRVEENQSFCPICGGILSADSANTAEEATVVSNQAVAAPEEATVVADSVTAVAPAASVTPVIPAAPAAPVSYPAPEAVPVYTAPIASPPPRKKNLGMTIGIVVISVIALAAIVVAVLFATGVIGKKNEDVTEPVTQSATEGQDLAVTTGKNVTKHELTTVRDDSFSPLIKSEVEDYILTKHGITDFTAYNYKIEYKQVLSDKTCYVVGADLEYEGKTASLLAAVWEANGRVAVTGLSIYQAGEEDRRIQELNEAVQLLKEAVENEKSGGIPEAVKTDVEDFISESLGCNAKNLKKEYEITKGTAAFYIISGSLSGAIDSEYSNFRDGYFCVMVLAVDGEAVEIEEGDLYEYDDEAGMREELDGAIAEIEASRSEVEALLEEYAAS